MSGLDEAIGALAESELFSRVDPARLKLIALTAEVERYAAGETLCEQGDEGDSMYVIVNGAVEARATGPSGPVVLARLGRGALVGEIAAITEEPRTASLVAVEDLAALRLDGAALRKLLLEFPDLSLRMITMIARRLSATNRKFAEARGEA